MITTTNRIYIHYTAERYYTTEEELRGAFEDYGGCESFEEWLNDHYSASEIFGMDEKELAELQEDYDNFYNFAVQEWAEYYLEIVNLSADVSVS